MDVRELPLEIRTKRIIRPGLKILYPQIGGLKNIIAKNKINRTIYKKVIDLINRQGDYIEMLGKYEIKTNERGVLSLTLINYAFSGGAHGMTLLEGLSFDLETGELYQLQDLFREGSNYQQLLSQEVAEQIKEREIPLLEEFTGIRVDQDYYIADKALVLFFQLYEIAPYYYGFQYFPISIYKLEDIINQEGILNRMISWYNY